MLVPASSLFGFGISTADGMGGQVGPLRGGTAADRARERHAGRGVLSVRRGAGSPFRDMMHGGRSGSTSSELLRT